MIYLVVEITSKNPKILVLGQLFAHSGHTLQKKRNVDFTV